MSARESLDEVAWPVLSAAELAEIAPFGEERAVADGELLFQAGEATDDLFVVLEGEVEVVARRRRRGVHRGRVTAPGGFVGELTPVDRTAPLRERPRRGRPAACW